MLQRYRGMRQSMIDTSSVFVTFLRKIGIMSGPSPAHILPDKRESNAGTALIRIDKHCPRSLQGRTGASARFPAWEPKQRRCRRSEAEPHAPPGLSPQVTGGEQTGFLKEILNVSMTDSGHK